MKIDHDEDSISYLRTVKGAANLLMMMMIDDDDDDTTVIAMYVCIVIIHTLYTNQHYS